MKDRCKVCQKLLTPDEIAVTKKLINRGCKEFFCVSCLAAQFQIPVDVVEKKIRYFKAIGCTLFEP